MGLRIVEHRDRLARFGLKAALQSTREFWGNLCLWRPDLWRNGFIIVSLIAIIIKIYLTKDYQITDIVFRL
ncbi:MAG TPA: hypothetical protein GXX19_09330 [Syntrophomonadaceae bacterium]|nr:hypothetical protein [Syntrophomonadaceae bacterium]